jgi:SEC-C motif domain protein
LSADPASGAHCPCGRRDARGKALTFAECCGRYLEGGEWPADAATLMRSRYTAFVRANQPYLLATWHPGTRPPQVGLDPATKWLGLEVRDLRDLDEGHAEVEFVARSRTGSGPAERLHELSRFVCEGGRWYYLDGAIR